MNANSSIPVEKKIYVENLVPYYVKIVTNVINSVINLRKNRIVQI